MSTQPFTDTPKLLADPAACTARSGQLHEPHIAPLTALVETLCAQVGPHVSIPNFDPWDGGIDAEILYLLEAPGPKAVLTGFVSRNNPDETAKNFFEVNAEAKIPRKRTVTWNIMPWYIGDSKRIRSANRDDLQTGICELPRFFLSFQGSAQSCLLDARPSKPAVPSDTFFPGSLSSSVPIQVRNL